MLQKASAGFTLAVPVALLAAALLARPAASQIITESGEVIFEPACGPNEFHEPPCEFPIVTNKELFIIDPCVVDDPCRTRWDGMNCDDSEKGAWTFGKLAASLAHLPSIDSDPQILSDFVLNWLNQHLNLQVVNGQDIAGRPGMANFIDEWLTVSEHLGSPRGQLNMRVAPFRLLAIVNRMDLRDAPAGYAQGNAGEGRFVFNFLDIPPEVIEAIEAGQDVVIDPTTWPTRLGNVILEYELVAETCGDVFEWANRWHNLGNFDFPEPYNTQLQKLTDDFAGFEADPNGPNQSALNQLRTNEITFSQGFTPTIWELREFQLPLDSDTPPPTQLKQVVVALTVRTALDDSIVLGDWMKEFEIPINHDEHSIPLTFGGEFFAAGSSLNPTTQIGVSEFFWKVPNGDPTSEPDFDFDCSDTRFNFAINNCNGCHARDADVSGFFQVRPRAHNQKSDLSEFLTGDPVSPPPPPPFLGGEPGTPDPTCPLPPTTGAVVRFFDDIQRRAFDLCDLLTINCPEGAATDLAADMAIFNSPHRLKLRVH